MSTERISRSALLALEGSIMVFVRTYLVHNIYVHSYVTCFQMMNFCQVSYCIFPSFVFLDHYS